MARQPMTNTARLEPGRPLTAKHIYLRLRRARAMIDGRYDHPLNLDQLAREAGFSRYHFIRLFRQAYRQTPHQYLTRKRIEKAKELLADEALSVTEVCLAVGFQSLGSFSTLFHKYVGQSPQRYRLLLIARRKYVPACFLIMAGIEVSPGAGPK